MDDLDSGKTIIDLGPKIRSFFAGQKLFGRYTLEKILGRGGMGVVWRARDDKLEREVALKFLPEMMALDEQAVADLKRETKKSQELRHHHIVSVYDFVSDDEAACIAMEYVDGPTLSALKARKENNCLEVDELKPWLEQLCEALSYAHEKAKVVHRDLKPANLMVNGKSELKVADFGIARSMTDSISMLTMTRGTSGTLVYMSPQQLNGERASHLDDIYSLGATIYELTTGKPPFYGSGDLTYQIKNNVPPLMTPRRQEFNVTSPVPEEWEKVVADCLAKNPEQRPQSVAEIAERLGVLRTTTRTKRAPSSPTGPAESARVLPEKPTNALPPVKSKLGWLPILGGLLTVAVIGAVWYWGFHVPAEKPLQKEQAEQKDKPASQPTVTPKDEAATRLANARGAVLIQTEPAGAIVTFGTDSRKTPATFNGVKVGSWPIKVEREGYETVEQNVSVEESTINELPVIKLARSTGQAHIESKPTGMKFELVDADAEHHPGKTPADLEKIPIGTGRVMFTPEGAAEHWQEIKILRNKTATITWQAELAARPMPAVEPSKSTPPPAAILESTFKNSLGRNMVWIPLLRIWVCETEVTQGEFVSLMGHNPSQNSGSEEFPVDSVTVAEATEFCARLTNKETASLPLGHAYSLPTDSQWSVFGANASLEDSVTSQTRGRSGPARVKSLSANEFGLYDTRGNVWEWTRTAYSASLNSPSIRAEFSGLDSQGNVLRGGSWRSKGNLLLPTTRGSNRPSLRDSTNGFRVILAPRN